MAWRYHSKCAVDPRKPLAAAVCDRCSQWFRHVDLRFQYEWTANELYNTRFLVCSKCYDTPQIQFKTTRLPPDPLPILNPRVEPFLIDEEGPQNLTVWDETGACWDTLNSEQTWDQT